MKTKLVTATTLALMTLATAPRPAQAHDGAGVAIGVAGGLIAGAAIASAVQPRPIYYTPPPTVVYQSAPVATVSTAPTTVVATSQPVATVPDAPVMAAPAPQQQVVVQQPAPTVVYQQPAVVYAPAPVYYVPSVSIGFGWGYGYHGHGYYGGHYGGHYGHGAHGH